MTIDFGTVSAMIDKGISTDVQIIAAVRAGRVRVQQDGQDLTPEQLSAKFHAIEKIERHANDQADGAFSE